MKHELKRLGFDVPRTTWSFQAQKPGADIPEGLQKQHGGTINDDSGAGERLCHPPNHKH